VLLCVVVCWECCRMPIHVSWFAQG